MRILRVDRRVTGAALATAFCLLIPSQQKPFGWLSQQAGRFAHRAGVLPAPQMARDISAPAQKPAIEAPTAEVAANAIPPDAAKNGIPL